MTLFDDAFEASEPQAPLTNETSRTNLTKITSSLSFSLFQDALAGSELTDDEEATATSGPDEGTRAGGVMEGLIHGTRPFPGCCCGFLLSQCTHQSADISDHTKMHKYNTKLSQHNIIWPLY
ncbi:hypothetical protein M9458_053515 [Cirrhinus mrigala]|uniref:C2H2-type domain-containing protein n=1 Tax=Cirrhinus mrigala TaxID=683832 RepID=A0ABD0MQF0_CIRMR